MSVQIQPISQLSDRARYALVRELGVVDSMRFLRQFRSGSGNYTAERDQLFGDKSVKSIVAEIEARR